MRKTLVILSIFSIIGLVFIILPMGTLAFTVVLPAMVFAIMAFFFSKENSKKLPKWLLIVTLTLFLAVLAKEVLLNDKVAKDTNFIQEKEKSMQEAQKELEEIEGLE